MKQEWLPGSEGQRHCEKTESKVDLLAKIFTQAGHVDEIESIKAIISSKDGSTMTVEHPAVEEKVKQANESSWRRDEDLLDPLPSCIIFVQNDR